MTKTEVEATSLRAPLAGPSSGDAASPVPPLHRDPGCPATATRERACQPSASCERSGAEPPGCASSANRDGAVPTQGLDQNPSDITTTRGDDPRARRLDRRQLREREARQAARQRALDYARHVPTSEAARQLRCSPRTLRHWKTQRGGPGRRGRPCKQTAMTERNEILRFLHKVSGPVVGLEALRALFPRVARCTLVDMLRRYRKVWSRRYRQSGFRLTWRRAGAVWAIDFSQPLQPIDGACRYLFAVRDLASHHQLAWLPFGSETAEETIRALEHLFREHGPPLVIKSDNGSAFIAETFRELLGSWRVEQLFSPPRHPQYNGALERSNGTLKTYTQLHAARQGHPFRWTSEDVEGARQLANTLTRPWGYRGATPEEAWEARGTITAADRQAFQAAVARHRLAAAADLGLDGMPVLSATDSARRDRLALSRALVELEQLAMQRVSRAPRKPPRRSRAELVWRAITAPGVLRLGYQPRLSADILLPATPCGQDAASTVSAQDLPAPDAALPPSPASPTGCYKQMLAPLEGCDTMPGQSSDGASLSPIAAPS